MEKHSIPMGVPQTPSPPHLYSQQIQLKLYQAFIFSVPILFTIILVLLFYLFYLKRRDSNLSSQPPTLPSSLNQPTSPVPLEELKQKLPMIMFDEDLKARDSQCCVCLGEFEIKEQLHQIPVCKHVFHIECIHHWLHANPTCPLCRSSIDPNRKPNWDPPLRFNLFRTRHTNSDQLAQPRSSEHEVVNVVID